MLIFPFFLKDCEPAQISRVKKYFTRQIFVFFCEKIDSSIHKQFKRRYWSHLTNWRRFKDEQPVHY